MNYVSSRLYNNMSSRISLPNKLVSHKSCNLTQASGSSWHPKNVFSTLDNSYSPLSRNPSQVANLHDDCNLSREKTQVRSLTIKCRQQNKCIQELQQYIDELECANSKKATTIQRLSVQNQILRQDNQFLKEKIKNVSAGRHLQSTKNLPEDLSEICLRPQQKENQSANCELRFSGDQIQKLTQRLSCLKQQNERLQNQVECLKLQVEGLKADYERQRKQVQLKEQEIQQLETRAAFEKNRKEREIDGLKSELRLKEVELQKMASLHGVLEGERQRRDRQKSEERAREKQQLAYIRLQWVKQIERMESIFHNLHF